MKKILVLGIALGLFGSTSSGSALADPINGDFELNNLSGWTSTGQVSTTSAGTDPRTKNNLSLVGVGNHSAKVGDQNAYAFAGVQYSSITQSWVRDANFDHLYVAWAAVGLVPTNIYHSVEQTPWFQINVFDETTNTTIFNKEYFTGNPADITSGWLAGATQESSLGQNSAGTWYYRPWEIFDMDMASIALGDILKTTLTTRDCTLSAHASYAYLDQIGSTPPQLNPSAPVPEPATMVLFGAGLAGLIGARLRKKK